MSAGIVDPEVAVAVPVVIIGAVGDAAVTEPLKIGPVLPHPVLATVGDALLHRRGEETRIGVIVIDMFLKLPEVGIKGPDAPARLLDQFPLVRGAHLAPDQGPCRKTVSAAAGELDLVARRQVGLEPVDRQNEVEAGTLHLPTVQAEVSLVRLGQRDGDTLAHPAVRDQHAGIAAVSVDRGRLNHPGRL